MSQQFQAYQNRAPAAPGGVISPGFQSISGPAGESALGRYLKSLMTQNGMSTEGRAYANELAQRYYGVMPSSYTGTPSASPWLGASGSQYNTLASDAITAAAGGAAKSGGGLSSL